MCLKFLIDFQTKYGKKWSDDDIREYAEDYLARGRVIPGYGHAVLRETDPRFICQLDFAEKNIKDDNLINLVKGFYKVVPDVLTSLKKVSNPWPNVDASSGALLMHYGIT